MAGCVYTGALYQQVRTIVSWIRADTYRIFSIISSLNKLTRGTPTLKCPLFTVKLSMARENRLLVSEQECACAKESECEERHATNKRERRGLSCGEMRHSQVFVTYLASYKWKETTRSADRTLVRRTTPRATAGVRQSPFRHLRGGERTREHTCRRM